MVNDVVPISEAKANLSKLVKRARAGEVIYLGAYGRADAVLAPVPARRPLAVGAWTSRRDAGFSYDDDALVGPDADLSAEVAASIDRDASSR